MSKPDSKRILLGVLLVVLSLGVLAGAVFATGGIDLLTGLFFGKPAKVASNSPVPPKPQVNETPTATPTPASNTPTTTPSVQPAEIDLSAEESRMYWEQFDSEETIGELVAGKWASFTVKSVASSTDSASLAIGGTYTNGARVNGTVVLRGNADAWYFASITRAGRVSSASARGTADSGVVRTLVSEQAEEANQQVLAGLVDGGYKTIAVDSVSKGSGTATINVTLSGGRRGTKAGRIVCISKAIDGRTHWFITRCEER